MSGMDEDAGGVLSARSNSSTKNATKMFMPAKKHVRLAVIISARRHRKLTTVNTEQTSFTKTLTEIMSTLNLLLML